MENGTGTCLEVGADSEMGAGSGSETGVGCNSEKGAGEGCEAEADIATVAGFVTVAGF